MKPTFHSLLISDINNETEDTVSIAFDVPSELSNDYTFKSGQYLTLRADIDNEDTRRSYSLCSSPFENEWRVAVKQVPDGKFSTYANNDLKVGMSLDVMTPAGNFALTTDANSSKSYVLFAAGSGVTPILSIAKSALHEEPNSDVTLFYGNKGFGSIIFREEIEALKNQYMERLRIVHVLSRESLGNPLQKGRIDKDKADQLFDAFLKEVDIDAVYLCGPEQMIHAVKESMTGKGVDESKIHFELFTTPSTEKKIAPPTDAPKIDANVIVIIDEEEIELNLASDGMNILDASQAAGGDVPYACKGGVCCTCKAKIIEGTARMDVNYSLEQEEIDEGFILTCQAHPTSDKLIVSFDE
ncbi:MAG: phenylacetate-CoA oxygenase/reductase subunit PaaK [Crocinitomicaceae bacterium]|nr:phenylacetate-CoA oxygenase/reductase subunit PaaK [Crocinitomicaceae bacterium]